MKFKKTFSKIFFKNMAIGTAVDALIMAIIVLLLVEKYRRIEAFLVFFGLYLAFKVVLEIRGIIYHLFVYNFYMGKDAKEEMYNMLKKLNLPYIQCDDLYDPIEYIKRIIESSDTTEKDKQNANLILGYMQGCLSVSASPLSGYFFRDIMENATEKYLSELEKNIDIS